MQPVRWCARAALCLVLATTTSCRDVPSALSPATQRDITAHSKLGPAPLGTWRVTLLASLGGTLMRGLAINDSSVVAGWGINGAGKTVAFRWTAGTLTTIAMPVFYQSARARAINNAGRIVGDVTLLSGQKKGFTSVPGVLASILPVWANSADGDHIPYGVSDDDVVVGDSPGYIPVSWTRVNNAWQVAPAGGALNSHYDAVTTGPWVVGTQVVPADAFRTSDLDGSPMQFIGALGPNPLETFATDVNASGQVVGIALRTGLPPTYFYWAPGAKMQDVGVQLTTPAGMAENFGSLSNLGRIAGVVGATLQAFTKRNGILDTLPLPAGAVLGFAEDVNTCGIITGWVMFNDWSTLAVIWRRYNGHQLLCDS